MTFGRASGPENPRTSSSGTSFLDDTWQKRTMPVLFPLQDCDTEPAWVWWGEFRKANQDKIYWDEKARRFRLSNVKIESLKH
jgi:hypothetical protein